MKPTLLAGDTLFVEKWSFSFSKSPSPAQGDVIIFSGKDLTGNFGLDYMKRVIALPGDKIAIKQGRVFLNDKPLPLSQIRGKPQGSSCFMERLPNGLEHPICQGSQALESFGPEIIPANSVFVIGDYRMGTLSSKLNKKLMNFGIIPVSTIKGKASYIWLSIQPQEESQHSSGWIPQFRFDRMFKRVI